MKTFPYQFSWNGDGIKPNCCNLFSIDRSNNTKVQTVQTVRIFHVSEFRVLKLVNNLYHYIIPYNKISIVLQKSISANR